MKPTPLEEIIVAMIREDGPMPLDRYMALCLGHPAHGYYMSRDPFGPEGDFITAPEISQIFGELIGIWCAAAFQALGAPADTPFEFRLVTLYPCIAAEFIEDFKCLSLAELMAEVGVTR